MRITAMSPKVQARLLKLRLMYPNFTVCWMAIMLMMMNVANAIR